MVHSEKFVEGNVNEKTLTKIGVLNDGVLESRYFLKQKPEPVTYLLHTFKAPLVCLQRSHLHLAFLMLQPQGELLTLLLTYPRLYFSLLLYVLSMCLDGSSSSGWQTPMCLPRATLKSTPL